jgi:hypothetical protein
MQAKLERGKAASGGRSVVRSGAIFAAGVSLIAALALSAPERALAACGGASHPAHASGGGGGGVHAATSRPAASGGGGAGGGSLGCANGASASALRGLPMASSGRVVEMGAHGTHAAMHPRNAVAARPTNATAHLRGVRPPRA